jgi:hypothetical protein
VQRAKTPFWRGTSATAPLGVRRFSSIITFQCAAAKTLRNSAESRICCRQALDVYGLQETRSGRVSDKRCPFGRMITAPFLPCAITTGLTQTVLLPRPLRFDHGTSTYTALKGRRLRDTDAPRSKVLRALQEILCGSTSRIPN